MLARERNQRPLERQQKHWPQISASKGFNVMRNHRLGCGQNYVRRKKIDKIMVQLLYSPSIKMQPGERSMQTSEVSMRNGVWFTWEIENRKEREERRTVVNRMPMLAKSSNKNAPRDAE
jgi:hypothetical protein